MERRGSDGMMDVVMRGIREGTSLRILVANEMIRTPGGRGRRLSEVGGRDGERVEAGMSEIEVVHPPVVDSVLYRRALKIRMRE